MPNAGGETAKVEITISVNDAALVFARRRQFK
jgi:hypothetical protein